MTARAALQRVVVSDVFGRTRAFDELVARLPGVVAVVDPYGGRERGFGSEAEAYAAFVSEVGLEGYTELLSHQLRSLGPPVSVIGFSVGGAAIWCLPADSPVSGGLCFYSSQVRHHADCAPVFPLQLVLPAFESHFSVDDLAHRVARHPGVTSTRTTGRHGFMNAVSEHFDARLYCSVLADLSALPPELCFSQCSLSACRH